MSDFVCPFCKESDFDAYGLKWHLLNGKCEPFEDIGTVGQSMFGLTQSQTAKE